MVKKTVLFSPDSNMIIHDESREREEAAEHSQQGSQI
jgi:hypothetical protein